MQIKGKYSWFKHIDFTIVDLISLIVSFFVAYYLKFHSLSIGTEWRRFIVIASLLNIIIAFVGNPYSGILRRRYYREIGRTFVIVVSNALCTFLFFYAFKIGADYSREVVFDTYILYFCFSVILKYIWKKLITNGVITLGNTKKMTLFLISSYVNAERDIHSIYSTDLSLYEIKGVHLIEAHSEGTAHPDHITYSEGKVSIEIPVIQDSVVSFILDNNIDEVMVSVRPGSIGNEFYQELIRNGVGLNYVVEPLLGLQTEEQFVTNIGVNKTLSTGTFSFSPAQSTYLIIKRFFDIICGLIGCVLLIPISICVKAAYLISGDKSKIFYRQNRVGQNGKNIRIWKFRSMVPNADERLKELLQDERYQEEWEQNQKFENDPRITRVGAFLRKTSLDEIPQLLNVLVGDMSLVGPRPLVEGELESHNGLKLYQKVKPGITGWWGCNGRSNINYHERLELEYYYVKNCSLYLDVLCILRTVFAVIKKEGAQ